MFGTGSRLIAAGIALALTAGAGIPAQGFERVDPPLFFQLWERYKLVGGSNGNEWTVGDLDGDGSLDAAIPPHLLRGLGDGRFRHWPNVLPILAFSIQFGDIDGDGDLDIVVGNGPYANEIYVNDGRGNFTRRVPFTPSLTHATSLADVDGDGDLDVFFANFGQQNTLWLNDGKGNFTDVTKTHLFQDSGHAAGVVQGDFDGDGDIDFVVANGHLVGPEVDTLYVNDGTGRFTQGLFPSNLQPSGSIAAGDIDGDGALDIVVTRAGYSNVILLYVNDGSGRFTDMSSRLPAATMWMQQVLLFDYDRDGDLDIMVASKGRFPTPFIYENTGNLTFRWAFQPSISHQSVINNLVPGDFDGDGDDDLLIVNNSLAPRTNTALNLQRQVYTQKHDTVLRGKPLEIRLFADRGHLVIPFIGTTRIRQPIPGLGVLRVDPATLVILPPQRIGVSRERRLELQIPADPWLRGARIHTQALDFDPTDPSASHLTNVIDDTIR